MDDGLMVDEWIDGYMDDGWMENSGFPCNDGWIDGLISQMKGWMDG